MATLEQLLRGAFVARGLICFCAQALLAAIPAMAASPTDESVLLIEEDSEVLELLKSGLDAEGFRVLLVGGTLVADG